MDYRSLITLKNNDLFANKLCTAKLFERQPCAPESAISLQMRGVKAC